MPGTTPLVVFFLVEPGYLEEQARFLCESIRHFGNSADNVALHAIQPRKSSIPLQPETPVVFNRCQVDFHTQYVNDGQMRDYALANKPCAAAWMEEQLAESDVTLLYLDTDVFVGKPLNDFILKSRESLAIRPAHYAQDVACREDNEPDEYWRELYRICGVDDPGRFNMVTTHDQTRVRCHINSGVISADPKHGLFRSWRHNLETIWAERFFEKVQMNDRQRRLLEQSCFSATMMAQCRPEEVRLLPGSHHYFVDREDTLPANERLPLLDDAVVAHYHRMFDSGRWESIPMSDELRHWLAQRLPHKSRHIPEWKRFFRRARRKLFGITRAG